MDGAKRPSDRREDITEESVVPAPKEGEGYSTGRGGAGNIHPQAAHPDKGKGVADGSKNVSKPGLV